MKTLSILFLGTQMAVGGAQHVLLTQALWFYEKGYRVTVAFFYDKENLESRWQARYPFPVIDLGIRRASVEKAASTGLLPGLARLWGLLRREKFDIIETFTLHSNLMGLPLALVAGVPIRIASHHGKIEVAPRWLERVHGRMVNWGVATSLVAVSPRVSRLAVDEEGMNMARISVIPNGVNLPSTSTLQLDDRVRVRQSLGINDDAPLVVSVGRLTAQKGHTYLLQAIPGILARFPGTIFALVGDGSLRADLEQEAGQLGCKANVRFLGTRDDVYQLLHAADIFVLPSVSEGMPMALLEAMGMGVAVVASNLDGIAAVIEDGQQGLLVPPTEIKSLTFAISRLLKDSKLRETLAKNGQYLVQEQYAVDRMCEQYEAVFMQSIKQEKS